MGTDDLTEQNILCGAIDSSAYRNCCQVPGDSLALSEPQNRQEITGGESRCAYEW